MSRDTGGGAIEKEETAQELNVYKDAYVYQSMTRRVRNAMLTRQKRDWIALMLKINDLTESLRSKNNIYITESKIQMNNR